MTNVRDVWETHDLLAILIKIEVQNVLQCATGPGDLVRLQRFEVGKKREN